MATLLERIETLWCSLPEAAQDALDEAALEKRVRCGLPEASQTELKSAIWDFMRRIRCLRGFRQMTFAPQRSAEWLELRKNLLTASDLASALGKGKFITRPKLIQSKAEARRPISLAPPLGVVFAPPPLAPKPYKSPALSWGTMFEPMIARIYSEKHNDIHLYEFGLIRHPTLTCFGASPDGITETGKMVEIKCPWKRAIKAGEVPEQYYLQIQGQLSVCQLEQCDYIEVVMDDIPDEAAYYERVAADATHAHGVILEYQTAEDTTNDRVSYEYSPAKLTPTEAYAWAMQWVRDRLSDPTLHVMRVRPWRMTNMNLVPVSYDPDLWDTLVPQIQQFWNEVEEKTRMPGVLNESYDASEAGKAEVPTKPKVSRPRKTAKYAYRDDAEPTVGRLAKPVQPMKSATPATPAKYTYRDDADD